MVSFSPNNYQVHSVNLGSHTKCAVKSTVCKTMHTPASPDFVQEYLKKLGIKPLNIYTKRGVFNEVGI